MEKGAESENMRIYLNDKFKFAIDFKEKFLSKSADYFKKDKSEKGIIPVRIPHSVVETPYNYFDEEIYQKVSAYVTVIKALESWKDKKVLVTFEGAAHRADVYLNGKLIYTHLCGYTAFTIDLSSKLNYGNDNVLLVKLDSRESLNVPPFGFVIDYMTYGGIYRDVYLDIRNKDYIEDVFAYADVPAVYAEDEKNPVEKSIGVFLGVDMKVQGTTGGLHIKHFLERYNSDVYENYVKRSGDDKAEDSCASETFIGESDVNDIKGKTISSKFHLKPVVVWDSVAPALYLLKSRLYRGDELLDEKITRIGFRRAEFKADGFYLNGRKFKIRGLNRHQSYPYVGYAMPKSMQVMDADILRNELGVNAVRTSHYPQSQYFIDRCDELGLLTFMEFPGWQHIGDAEWIEQAIVNEKEMIEQFRNHPSIFIWGIRINESEDSDEFYIRTNKLAHELDSTRPTGGVRAHVRMHLLEDVYTYNDFSHNGKAPGCMPKKKVTPDMSKPYLITEYNGHMYPTKTYDNEEIRSEHALRHTRVMDSVMGQDDISGAFGWCMFDYNTHKDFGSGDRICYHGVMDMFRNPKLAAAAYSCQSDKGVFLEVTSSMDIGEHPECIRKDAWIYSNADSVRMYKNGVFIKEYSKKDSPFKNIDNGPYVVDDFVGDQLIKSGIMNKKLAARTTEIMNHIARNGMANIPKKYYLTGLRLLLINRMSMTDIVNLYQKYIGDWGGKSTEFKFEAIRNGNVVGTVIKKPVMSTDLRITTSTTNLIEDISYDVAAVRIQAVDEFGNVLPQMNEAISFKTEGPIELIGPATTALRGGRGGTYVRTTGIAGKARLIVETSFAGVREITFDVTINNN